MSLFDSYSQGLTDIATWLHRQGDSDITAIAPDLLRMGELRIYRDLRIRAMEASLSATIASGVIAVPSGYVDLKHARINGTPVQKLERKDAEWIYYNYPTRSADGKPGFIARDADSFIFGPYPDSAYTVSGTYYKRLDPLSGSNTTNWFTANAPDLLLFACMAEAEPFTMNDERALMWEAKYKLAKDKIQREDDQEEFSGSPLSMTRR